MIKFLRDFQSQHTGENFYAAGTKAELGGESERALIAEGAAEIVTIDSRLGQIDPTEETTPRVSLVARGRPRKA